MEEDVVEDGGCSRGDLTWEQEEWSPIVASPVAVLGLQAAVELHPLQRRLHSRVDGWTSRHKLTLNRQCVNLSYGGIKKKKTYEVKPLNTVCLKRSKTGGAHRVQAQGMGLQHGLRSVWSLPILQVAPGLPALLVAQPPAAQVGGRLRLVGPSSPPQVPVSQNKHVPSPADTEPV